MFDFLMTFRNCGLHLIYFIVFSFLFNPHKFLNPLPLLHMKRSLVFFDS